MLKANIEAQIESLIHERECVRNNIITYDNLINKLKRAQEELLERETDLCYEIDDMKEQLYD